MDNPKRQAAQDDSWTGVRDGAVTLKLSYGQTLRLIEIGVLEGRRSRKGRWLVSVESVKALRAKNDSIIARDDGMSPPVRD